MSKNHYHNYNAISNKKSDNSSESVETKISVNDEEVESVKVETTVVTTESEPVPTKPTLAYVSGCVRLNIRKEPNPKSSIIGILNADEVVEIDTDNSTDSFYKISNPKVEGYCMKQYITIEQ